MPDGRSPSGLKTEVRWITIFEGSAATLIFSE